MKAVAVWLLSALLPVAAAPTPSTAGALVEPVPEFSTLDQFDTLLDARSRMVWSVRNEPGEVKSLIFGKPLVDYAEQYVFTPAAETRLTDLRVKAGSQSAAGDRAALADTLQQARAAMDLEAYRLAVLYAYRTLSSGVTAHEAALQAFMDKAPEAEQKQSRARLDPLLEQAKRGVDELLGIATLDELRRAFERNPASTLPSVYNEERMRLAPFAAAWDREHGVRPMSRTRSRACNPPHPRPATTGKPEIERTSLTEPEYPPEARRLAFEGSVHVRADISTRGCAERMEIARSSGVEALDASALAWAEGLRFHPAQVDGEPQSASHTFAVTFRLDD